MAVPPQGPIMPMSMPMPMGMPMPGAPGAPGVPGAPPAQSPWSSPPTATPVGFRTSVLEKEGKDKKGKDKKKKREGKKGKSKRGRRDSSSSSSDEECQCKSDCPPATQIFISPPGPPSPLPPPQFGADYGMGPMCAKCNSPKRPDQARLSSKPQQGYMDASKLCAQQCWGGGRADDIQTQVVCCPTPSQKQTKRKNQSAKPTCTCCTCGEGEEKKKKRPQHGTMEGMMPASQQFLMFLQAYGLAAALIRDRNRREDERAAQEEAKRAEERKSGKSQSRRSSSKSADRSKTPAKKEKKEKK